MNDRKIGAWLIGALGSISSAVILGALALRNGIAAGTGMVTGTDHFRNLDLASLEALEFGGCDIRHGSLIEAAYHIASEAGCMSAIHSDDMKTELARIQTNILQGTARNCGQAIEKLVEGLNRSSRTLRDEIDRVIAHLDEFRASNGLDEVVVVNLASTEPPLTIRDCHTDIGRFEKCLDRNETEAVRASTIYAYAAIRAGCPYINFTPSNGALFPAMIQLAERNGVPVMGNDGKTGETLVKSALAPLFMCRNLEVMSWEGFNILGNMDGLVLDYAENKESKLQTKDAVLSKILGYKPHSQVHINYVPSLGDRKTAWDFIHFRGFLGADMSLQFVWQGYDSLLAAPLVLDLVRFADLARRRGESGLMTHLASFFKDPLGVNEHRLYEQFRKLVDYARQVEKTGGRV